MVIWNHKVYRNGFRDTETIVTLDHWSDWLRFGYSEEEGSRMYYVGPISVTVVKWTVRLPE